MGYRWLPLPLFLFTLCVGLWLPLQVKRMVGAYDPTHECVIVKLKPDNRVSTYQVQFPSEQEPPGAGASLPPR